MKKEQVKKLHLTKIKIASMNAAMQDDQKKEANAPTYTGCSLYKCPPPPDGRK
jgi:hypothetical protein